MPDIVGPVLIDGADLSKYYSAWHYNPGPYVLGGNWYLFWGWKGQLRVFKSTDQGATWTMSDGGVTYVEDPALVCESEADSSTARVFYLDGSRVRYIGYFDPADDLVHNEGTQDASVWRAPQYFHNVGATLGDWIYDRHNPYTQLWLSRFTGTFDQPAVCSPSTSLPVQSPNAC